MKTTEHLLMAITMVTVTISMPSISAREKSPSNCFLNQEKSGCETSTHCTWIPLYQTSKGKSASGYCRVMTGYSQRVGKLYRTVPEQRVTSPD
jgi:hypothetical protein